MYRDEYLAALRLLARAFDLAEARGVVRPVVVGGAAVEFYTQGGIVSGDIDIVTPRDDLVGEALIEVGFRREDRMGRLWRGFYHLDLLMGVEFVSGALFDGLTDRSRLRLATVDRQRDAKIVFPPPEDMIADRLAQYASDPKGRDDMLEQARLLCLLVEPLDMAYLKRRVVEEGADPDLIDRFLSEPKPPGK